LQPPASAAASSLKGTFLQIHFSERLQVALQPHTGQDLIA
jgi:hypothetical protein